MSGNFFKLLTKQIAGNDTYILDLDLRNIRTNVKLQIGKLFAALEPAADITVTVYNGYGNADPNATVGAIPYVEGGSSVPNYNSAGTAKTLTPPTAGSIVWSDFVISSGQYSDQVPSWQRLVFQNTDTSNPGTVTIQGDM